MLETRKKHIAGPADRTQFLLTTQTKKKKKQQKKTLSLKCRLSQKHPCQLSGRILLGQRSLLLSSYFLIFTHLVNIGRSLACQSLNMR